MTNLIYNSMTFNVVYVDPTISSAGDGSTPATALKDLPTTLVNKTCYIIRRTIETSFVNLSKTNNSGLTHIMIIGMPKSDSQLYPLLAEEVTSVWDADEAKYANVRCNSSSYTSSATASSIFYEKNIELFVSEYCYYYRDGESGSASSNLSPIFYNDDETTKSNYIFKNCKFGYTQYDLDNDAYLSSNTDVSTDTSKYPQNKCGGYILIYTANSMIFDNCIFNWVVTSRYGNDDDYAMHNCNIAVKRYVKTFGMYNSTLNRLCRDTLPDSDYYRNYGIYIEKIDSSGNFEYRSNDFILKNITINYILSSKNTELGKPVYICSKQNSSCDIENITINFKYMQDYDINVNGLTSTKNKNAVLYFTKVDNLLKIKNIICDNTTDNKTAMDSFPILCIDSFNIYQLGTPSYIQDIKCKFLNNKSVYKFNSDYIVKIYGSNQTHPNLSNGNIDELPSYWETATSYRGNLIENVNIDAQQMTNYAFDLQKVAVKTNELKCRTRMIGSTMEVNSYYNNLSNMDGIVMSVNSYLKCNDYQANIENFNGTPQISFDMFSSAYVGKTNCILYNENPIIKIGDNHLENPLSLYNMQLTCPNYISTGQFFARNGYVYAKSWTVSRTGSTASASLKLSNNYQQNYPYPLIIGMTPYKGIELVPSATGKHKVTCYVASKMLTENELVSLNQNCWFEIRVPKTQEDGTVLYTVYTTKGNCWYNDESTWSNDVELKSFKIETEIDVKESTTPIEVKIGYCQYSANGYVYIDPDIKLTQVA